MKKVKYTEELAQRFYELKQQNKSYDDISDITNYKPGFIRNCLIKYGKPINKTNAWTTKRQRLTKTQLKKNACDRTITWRQKHKGFQVYKLLFPDGKFYIGQTKQGARLRFNDHWKTAELPYLREYKSKGGKRQDIKVIILEELLGPELLEAKEIELITKQINNPLCVNQRISNRHPPTNPFINADDADRCRQGLKRI
tara:strand:+ start:561 stop:1154 length:594 start_codon:yes stop_codon:yes gene_type:complete